MITQIIDVMEKPFNKTEAAVVTNYGLSTDTKPVTAKNGDIFFEMDTSKVFMFDLESKTWLEL